MIQPPWQSMIELFPESETEYFMTAAELRITFLRDDRGMATGPVITDADYDLLATKIG